jgi:heterodisulfide reductase subunit C/quinone-modifying oxidoreductase subunit QmoC
MVERHGRSYEVGLATRHYLRHFPLRLPWAARIGFGMLTRRRMSVTPRTIEGIRQLKAILARAKEIEEVA